jgi:hypothetical protein
VVTYLFFGAFALGWLRRLLSTETTPILAVVGYLHFTLVEGATNLIHNGFLSSLASAMLAVAAIGLTTVYVVARRSLHAMARPATPVTASADG